MGSIAIRIREGTAPIKVIQFYDYTGKATQNVSALLMVLNIYTNDGRKTLLATRAMANTINNYEKSITFLLVDSVPGQYYIEIDIGGTPPVDGLWGYLYVDGQ